jgi:hypothetical protein
VNTAPGSEYIRLSMVNIRGRQSKYISKNWRETRGDLDGLKKINCTKVGMVGGAMTFGIMTFSIMTLGIIS